MGTLVLTQDDPVAQAAMEAVREGDVAALRSLLSEKPELAGARIADRGGTQRTLLHVLTDWPGHVPGGPETAAVLIEAGADVNAPAVSRNHSETPLHWAASCDDVEVLDVLLDAGADPDAGGGVLGGGTPMADAVAFAQWGAAQHLLERGARTDLWQEAALGLVDRVAARLEARPRPAQAELDNALWCAAHGGQRATAELLVGAGANPAWVGHNEMTAAAAAQRAGAHDLAQWLAGLS